MELFSFWLGLSGRGIGTAGEKVAEKAIPFGRPTARDKRRTGRILKGDMAELHALYSRLYQYANPGRGNYRQLSWQVVGKVRSKYQKFLESAFEYAQESAESS